MRPWRRGAGMAAALALLAGCAVGPDYRAPSVEVPASWQPEQPWRHAAPNDAADKGRWWQRFGDPQLDALQQKALAGNQTLALASARRPRPAPRSTRAVPRATRKSGWARALRA